jgi:hypothetical protein
VASILLISLVTCVANAATWRFDQFSIDWPDGYVRLPKPDVAVFVNSDGIAVTVDVLNHRAMSPQQEAAGAPEVIQGFRRYASEQLVAVAARHGHIAIPLREETLSGGRILFSLADEQASRFGLFFLLISLHGNIAQLVVEGPGVAAEQMPRFRPLIEAGHWTGEAASASDH